MGRPKVYKHGREELGIYLNPEEMEAFEEIRWRERKDKTELGRIAVLEYIRAHKDGNDTFKLDKWHEDPQFKAVPTISSRSEIWYRYLQNCTDEELTNFMIMTNRVNQQCKVIKGLK